MKQEVEIRGKRIFVMIAVLFVALLYVKLLLKTSDHL
ncbi:Protein of unknown function [Bacillus mycoides]|nr:Protein of unknown function [Bacillus mycoides]